MSLRTHYKVDKMTSIGNDSHFLCRTYLDKINILAVINTNDNIALLLSWCTCNCY